MYFKSPYLSVPALRYIFVNDGRGWRRIFSFDSMFLLVSKALIDSMALSSNQKAFPSWFHLSISFKFGFVFGFDFKSCITSVSSLFTSNVAFLNNKFDHEYHQRKIS